MLFVRSIYVGIFTVYKNMRKKTDNSLTEGNILRSLVKFALPVLFALFLQTLYGAVDLLIVGRFAETADVSGVATGSQMLMTLTTSVTALCIGVTVLVGRRIGEKEPAKAGEAIGAGIYIFAAISAFLMIVFLVLAGPAAVLMQAPSEAFSQTEAYIRICGGGAVFIVAYNLLGAVFRGLGDSRTPMITVAIACFFNILLDLVFVAVLHKGAAGAAAATVIAQGISVLISLVFIRRKDQPFEFSVKYIRFNKPVIADELKIGTPIFVQEILVGVSFIVIQAIANSIGVVESAGVGVAEKMIGFLMLVPSSYMQSMTAFVAQNMGAGKYERANRSLWISILTSLVFGMLMSAVALFAGDNIASLFSRDAAVISAAHSYLKAYAIDCMLTPFLFCFIGFFNGCEKTFFVMIQGVVCALGIRVPVAFLMSRLSNTTLFLIGLSTPCATVIQIVMCLAMYFSVKKYLFDGYDGERI